MAKELYGDLMNVNPEDLLRLDNFALTFARTRLKLTDVIKWDTCITNSLQDAINQYKEKVVGCLKLLLPELAKGWFIQRGNIFGFGDYDINSPRLVTLIDPELLKKAPINNIPSEQAVATINYALGIRGRGQLDAASSGYLKGRNYDLIEQKRADEFLKHKKQVAPVDKLITDWKQKQSELQESGLEKKHTASLVAEKRKISDLQKLKLLGGPVTTPEEVDEIEHCPRTTEQEKQARFYLEVRYIRDSTLSLPKNSPIFRLKEKYKNLSSGTYAKNLKVYLSKISSSAAATWNDFDDAICKLQITRS